MDRADATLRADSRARHPAKLAGDFVVLYVPVVRRLRHQMVGGTVGGLAHARPELFACVLEPIFQIMKPTFEVVQSIFHPGGGVVGLLRDLLANLSPPLGGKRQACEETTHESGKSRDEHRLPGSHGILGSVARIVILA